MLIHADGFDHWGSRANMLIGGWLYDTNVGFQSADVTASNSRTGNYCLLFPDTVTTGYYRFRRIWNGTNGTAGFGIAINMSSVPAGEVWGFTFLDLAGNGIVTITIDQNGAYRVYRTITGNWFGQLLGTSAPLVFKPGAYNYVEVKASIDGTAGTVEVRQNGQTVVAILGNTGTTGTIISQLSIGKVKTGASASVDLYCDDLVIWDGTGTVNNDFLGERRCVTSFPTADTTTMDWTASSGTNRAALINATPPNISNYVEAPNPGNIAEFTKDAIGINATGVAGVVLFALAKKTGAGASTFRVGVNSAGFVMNSPKFGPGTGYAYYSSIVELDPHGTIPWTKTSINAANIRLTRED